jgi:hypothetical protein
MRGNRVNVRMRNTAINVTQDSINASILIVCQRKRRDGSNTPSFVLISSGLRRVDIQIDPVVRIVTELDNAPAANDSFGIAILRETRDVFVDRGKSMATRVQ